MLYRSPLTRFVLALAGIFAGLMLVAGPDRWRATPSLHWLAQAHIPLRVWGVAVVVYAVLLLFERTRPFAYACGACLWAMFTLSLFATIPEAGPKNSLALAGFVDVTPLNNVLTAAGQPAVDAAGLDKAQG